MNARTPKPMRRPLRAPLRPGLREARSSRRWSVLTVLILAATGVWVYVSMSPQDLVGAETGHVIRVQDVRVGDRPNNRTATIQLASGELVTARIPRGASPEHDEDVDVRIYEGRWPPYARSYELMRTPE